MNRSAALLLPAVAALALAAPRAWAQRQRLSMDPGWRFTLGDPAGAQAPRFDDRAWRRLDLPHDWSIEGVPEQAAPGGGRYGYFPTGIGWYRKAFRMPRDFRRGHGEAWLQFDGVYMNSDVWINGYHLGHRPYGYISFEYDVTQHLVPGVNVIAVRVDNSRQPSARWYTGSGIYRHVWLIIKNPLHLGHWAVYVTTPEVDTVNATVAVRSRVENDAGAARRAVLRSLVLDGAGRQVAAADTALDLGAGQRVEVEQRIAVSSPRIWSVQTPHLYTLRSELLEGARVVDTALTTFGIRTIAWDAARGFLLNGVPVKLKGVNLHEDGGAVGAAIPEPVWSYRLRRLRAMGANAIRTSHNPPSAQFLDLCDSLGFLVMAEAFDEWTIGKVPFGYHLYFPEWGERDAADFVRRDRDHPSIVLWSAGNEIGEQSTPAGVDVLRKLVAVFHREDPTRPVTTGNDQIDADGHPATTAFLDAEDVVGYNYPDRWHERRSLLAEPDKLAHPDWKMVSTETGNVFGGSFFFGRGRGGRSVGGYSLGGDSTVVHAGYTSGMIEAERVWKWVATHDYFAGEFIWTGVDYLGETFWPGKGAGAGALDITGHRKDSYWFWRSVWSDQPVLHLFPHWNWPGREGQTIPVLAYTDCNTVELSLNGHSLGIKALEFPPQGTSGSWNHYTLPVVRATTNDLHLSWDVPYQPGELVAVGKWRDGTACAADTVRTTGAPAALRLTAVRDTITDEPGDVALVRFRVVDGAGTVVPTADNLVRFTVAGGDIVALDNGDLTNHEPYRSDHREAFDGRGLAILRAVTPGVLTVTATADGLAPATAKIVVLKGQPLPAVPPAR